MSLGERGLLGVELLDLLLETFALGRDLGEARADRLEGLDDHRPFAIVGLEGSPERLHLRAVRRRLLHEPPPLVLGVEAPPLLLPERALGVLQLDLPLRQRVLRLADRALRPADLVSKRGETARARIRRDPPVLGLGLALEGLPKRAVRVELLPLRGAVRFLRLRQLPRGLRARRGEPLDVGVHLFQALLGRRAPGQPLLPSALLALAIPPKIAEASRR